MPARADVDPAEIVRLLPHIGIVDVQGPRLRCVLLGTSINDAFHADNTGKYLDEVLSGERLAFFEQLYRRVIDEGRAAYVENLYPVFDATPVPVERLLLPLSADGVAVNKVLLAMDFGDYRRGGIVWDSGPITLTRAATFMDPNR
jgi:hypothetical protein